MSQLDSVKKKLTELGFYEPDMTEQDMKEMLSAVNASLAEAPEEVKTPRIDERVKKRIEDLSPMKTSLTKSSEIQTKLLEGYRERYHNVNEQYMAKTWSEVRAMALKDQPFFFNHDKLELTFDEKVQLGIHFFNQQLQLIQAQQSYSTFKVPFGNPIPAAESEEISSEANNNEINNHITRFGRSSRKPVYYGFQNKEDFDLDFKPKSNPKTKTNAEVIATSKLFANDSKFAGKISPKATMAVSPKTNYELTEDSGPRENFSVQASTSKYESHTSALFDGLLDDSNGSENDMGSVHKPMEVDHEIQANNRKKSPSLIKNVTTRRLGPLRTDLSDLKPRNGNIKRKQKVGTSSRSKSIKLQVDESVTNSSAKIAMPRFKETLSRAERIFLQLQKNKEQAMNSPSSTAMILDSSSDSDYEDCAPQKQRGAVFVDTSAPNKFQNIKNYLDMQACPLCNIQFPMDQIEEHASSCTN